MPHDSRGTSPATPLWRFTLRQFFIGIALIALSCVALRGASSWWVSAMLGLTLFVLTASLLLVAYRRDADRAFWAGFATFGWVYVLLLMFGWSVGERGPMRTPLLFTDKLSRASHDWLYAEATTQTMAGSGAGGYGVSGMSGGGYAGMQGGMPGGDMSGGGYGSSMFDPSMAGGAGSVGAPPGYGAMGPMPPPAFFPPSKEHFANVAHAIWALLLAACGGWLAGLIYATQPRSSSAPAT